jgi:hypothetical protein
MNVYRKQSTIESERKPKSKFDAAFGTILQISQRFYKSKGKLFSLFNNRG